MARGSASVAVGVCEAESEARLAEIRADLEGTLAKIKADLAAKI
jgi:hypothetical protein